MDNNPEQEMAELMRDYALKHYAMWLNDPEQEMADLMRHYAMWLNDPDEMYKRTISELMQMVTRGHISFETAELYRQRAEQMAEHCKKVNGG